MIASSLDAAEDAIARATEYRDALIRQKRGLMQKLLTGEWRVTADATNPSNPAEVTTNAG